MQRREGATYLQSVETFYFEIVMSDEKLIELVRGYEELYDMSNKKYSDSYVKEKIWNSIGEELNKSGKIVNFIPQLHSLIVFYSLPIYILFYFLCH